MPTLLLIDDNSDLLLSLSRALKIALGGEVTIHAASTPARALEYADSFEPEVVVLDLNLNPKQGVHSGFALLKEILTAHPSTRVIILTGEGSTENGVRALSLGAANFLSKPPNIEHLRELIKDGITQAQLRLEVEKLKKESKSAHSSLLVGESDAIKKLREQLQVAAHGALPVLLQGETGVGKGVCAQEIHRISARAKKRFIRYQPTFGSADMVQSDLFGHAKGAFTGASEARTGLIKQAEGGTLFLDEIDEFPVAVQVSLLGVLQDKVVRAIGSDVEEQCNFKLVCASNADLEGKIAQKLFRNDLFHRISSLRITVPPLREHREDIPLLARSLLQTMNTREECVVQDLTPAALEKIAHHSWPGNIRELEAVISSSAIRAQFAGMQYLDVEHIQLQGAAHTSSAASTHELPFTEQVELFKQTLIERALAQCNGNQGKAAELLKVDRSSMRRIMARGS